MRAVQRINHNAAICEDGAGRQLIALGRGIGFGDMPHDVDLDVVTRTFYGIDSKYLAFIDEVDPEVLEFSAQLADIATGQLSYELSPNLPITLADHIQFAIKRAREHMVVSLPLKRDLEQLHPIEYRLGELAVRGIKKTFAIRMPQSEAAGIAMSIINAAIKPSERRVLAEQHEEHLLDMTVAIIQEELGVTVDRSRLPLLALPPMCAICSTAWQRKSRLIPRTQVSTTCSWSSIRRHRAVLIVSTI